MKSTLSLIGAVCAFFVVGIWLGCVRLRSFDEPTITVTLHADTQQEVVEELVTDIAVSTEVPVTEAYSESTEESTAVAETAEIASEVTAVETVCATEAEVQKPLIVVDGDVLDPDIADYLESALESRGIGWWMPYAICQAHQESSFHVDQITNGIDYGLFQYRVYYWEEWCDRAGVQRGDILNPYTQIDVYTTMVAKWIAEGRSVEETIGAHNYGGWTWDYDPQYVRDVMRWWK